MFNQQPSSSYTPLPSYVHHIPQTLNANPAQFASFSQPAVPSGMALIPPTNPPGTDTYANLVSYPSTHVGYEGQRQVFQDPNVCSYTWLGSAIPSQDYQVTSTGLTSLLNSNQNDQFMVNYIASLQNQTNLIQSTRCEVCKIDCNSRDVYEKHILGKKHKHKLTMLGYSSNSVLPKTSYAIHDINSSTESRTINGQMIPTFFAGYEDLEKKKQNVLTSGATVESVRECKICNVVCNSQDVFMKHMTGKKHAAQACLMAQNPFVAAVRSQYDNTWKKIPKQTKTLQSAWCDVCKINCNSNDVYVKHLLGKKHLKNVEKSSNPASNVLTSDTNLMIGPGENPNKQKPSAQIHMPEDLETKKRKVLESGADAGAVKICSLCNVICNSHTVLNFHLSGQKHASMMKKHLEGGGVSSVSSHFISTA